MTARSCTDDAWKALDLVLDAVRRAETKAGIALAGCGVTGGTLYSFAHGRNDQSGAFRLCVALCAMLLFASGLCAGASLWPRLGQKAEPTSIMYFHHIARDYPAEEHDAYLTALSKSMAGRRGLFSELGEQIWANARIAQSKYRWCSAAIAGLLLGIALLAVTVATTALPGA